MAQVLNISIIMTIIFGLLLVYPYMIYPLILRVLNDKPVMAKPGATFKKTLVFCAYNEARSMPGKIANLIILKEKHPDLQILAFDDGSSDGTSAQLQERSDIITLVQGGGRSGKAHGMKVLAKHATGDIIIFTDANVTLRDDAIDNLMAYYADANVGGVCGSLKYVGEGMSTTAAVGSFYWRLEEYLKKEESRTGNVMGADGSIFSLRRELYPDFPDTVLDDLTVSMSAVFNGKRLIKAEDVIAYEGLVASRGEEFSRKVRISARAFHTHLYLQPKLVNMQLIDKFKYGSRKFVRWFGGVFFILAVISATLSAFLIDSLFGFLFVATSLILMLSGMRTKTGPLASILEIIIALMATLLGVIRALRGQTFAIWNPAKSR